MDNLTYYIDYDSDLLKIQLGFDSCYHNGEEKDTLFDLKEYIEDR